MTSATSSLPRVLAVALFGLWLCGAAGAQLTRPYDTVLPNGLRVVVKSERSLGVVAINIVVRAGSRNEPDDGNGVAHLLEHMLFLGSSAHKPGEVNAFIEGTGGAMNAGTLRDFAHFYATVPADAFEGTLSALADAVLSPTLDAAELDRERRVVMSELLRQRTDPRAVMWDLAHETLFPDDPFGRPESGTPESLARIGREQLVAFHHRWYVPNNISVVIVGDIAEERAVAAAKKLFGGLTPSPATQPLQPDPPPVPTGDRVVQHGGQVAFVGAVVRGPGISHPGDVCAMDVLLALVGQGNASRLQALIQQPETAVMFAGAEFLTSRTPSPFLVWAACRPDKAAALKARLTKELDRVYQGDFSAADIAAAKRRLESSFWGANETYTDQADVLGFYEGIGSYRSATEYIGRVRAVTTEEIRRAARTYFAPKQRAWLMLLPQKPAPPPGAVVAAAGGAR